MATFPCQNPKGGVRGGKATFPFGVRGREGLVVNLDYE